MKMATLLPSDPARAAPRRTQGGRLYRATRRRVAIVCTDGDRPQPASLPNGRGSPSHDMTRTKQCPFPGLVWAGPCVCGGLVAARNRSGCLPGRQPEKGQVLAPPLRRSGLHAHEKIPSNLESSSWVQCCICLFKPSIFEFFLAQYVLNLIISLLCCICSAACLASQVLHKT